MQCHDPFYICKYYTDYFVYTVDQRETVEEIEINTSWWYILVEVGDKVVLDHGSDGGNEQWTDLRYIL